MNLHLMRQATDYTNLNPFHPFNKSSIINSSPTDRETPNDTVLLFSQVLPFEALSSEQVKESKAIRVNE